MLRDLLDLILPADCPCAGPGPLCSMCTDVLGAEPRQVRPVPAPAGLPECMAIGEYSGRMRDILLAYKERGRRDLGVPLGEGLAAVVASLAGPLSVALIPVAGTAAASRARSGDHMTRLARHAAAALRRAGRRATIVRALRALPRPDSAGLTTTQRAAAARGAFLPRTGLIRRWQRTHVPAKEMIILLDDVLTTGSTMASAAETLLRAGVQVDVAAVIAATRRLRMKALPEEESVYFSETHQLRGVTKRQTRDSVNA